MNSVPQIALLENQRSRPLWRLLGADLSTIWIAMLHTHLYAKERVIPSSILHERVAADLTGIRARSVYDLPGEAREYISMWVREGWVERRLPTDATEEEYELSTAAIDAIRFTAGMENPHAAATESRLALVMQAIAGLAEDTDASSTARLTRLQEERDRVDRDISAIEQGRLHVLESEAALERTREIIALGADIAEDFRRVRERFDQLNRDMRRQVMESDGSRAEVLEAMFAGIDVIGQSDAGRSFHAFWRLLTDPEQSARLDSAIEAIMERGFISQLAREDRKFLLRFKGSLLRQSRSVHQVMQDIARGLRSFVQTQEYSRQRLLRTVLKDAQRLAFEARTMVRPFDHIRFELALSTAEIRSVSQYSVPDPALHIKASAMVEAAPAETSLDTISELVNQADIDFRGLEQDIGSCLAEAPQVSIAHVLRQFPARQGLGSVVGLIAIGSTKGVTVVPAAVENVSWAGLDGVQRSANIPLTYFERDNFRERA